MIAYTAKYLKTSTGYMGQLVEWPEVVTEGKDLDECREMLRDALNEMLLSYIPIDITKAANQGFSSPDASWFKGEGMEFVKLHLLNERAKIYQVIDRQSLLPLIEQHLRGQQNRRLLIWSLLNVETCLDTFVE